MNNNTRNKSSIYLQSLADFIVDTKPYHSKLTEIIEEYQFSDSFNVAFQERQFVRNTQKAAWTYNFFSGGNLVSRAMPAKRLADPQPFEMPHPFGTENTDMSGVPFVYSKKQFDGAGVADAWMIGLSGVTLPYLEGHDFFQSHGSLEFNIHNVGVSPTWYETRAADVITTATALTQSLGLDLTNPDSAINKLTALITTLRTYLGSVGVVDGVAAADRLLAVLATGLIPQPFAVDTSISTDVTVVTGDYEALLNAAVAAGVVAPAPYTPPIGHGPTDLGWIDEETTQTARRYVDKDIRSLLPPMLLALHRDSDLYEGGRLTYRPVTTQYITVSNIFANPLAPYEEWTLEAVGGYRTWSITGSSSGFVGTFIAGFPHSGNLSFSSTWIDDAPLGTKVVLTPENRIVIARNAELETWNIIKVNPRTYSRPIFNSTNYGYIVDQNGVAGSATLLDGTLLAGAVTLTAIGDGFFTMTHSAEPTYNRLAQVDVPYDDGRLAFTIVGGGVFDFVAGDIFVIQIQNNVARVVDLDLYYGYDLDSYDNPDLLYDTSQPPGTTIDFKFDSRFTDYNLADLNLTVDETVPNGRSFRISAIPDDTNPIITLKRDGSGPTNEIDLNDAGLGPAVFSMPGDPDPAADLLLFYANQFQVEYSDDGFATRIVVATINVGDSYTGNGISFDLIEGSKPFVAVRTDAGVEGGDVFFFTVSNPPPFITNEPIGLISAQQPRLIMHGDSYYASIAAKWQVNFANNGVYSVTAEYADGPLSGTTIPGYPRSATLGLTSSLRAGLSYKDENIHFTVVQARGIFAGDGFSFETFARRPSFLVHGSVSGWQPDAEYDRWYWNGKIGFKIGSAKVNVYRKINTGNDYELELQPKVGITYPFPVGGITVNYVRPDAPAVLYTFSKVANGWLVGRNDKGAVGHCAEAGIFTDQYISVQLVGIPTDAVIEINPSEYDFWNATDTVIVRSNLEPLTPRAGDRFVVKKMEASTISINLDYTSLDTAVNIDALSPTAIDQDFIDVTTGSGIPLRSTSPEVALVDSWLPIYFKRYDTPTSPAEFSDELSIMDVFSCATSQLVGKLRPGATSLSEPTVFEFDPTFFTTYLPLNAQANIVAYGNGLDDNVRVAIAERLNMMISGNVILAESLFDEQINVDITDRANWSILSVLGDTVNMVLADGPFDGFLPGYSNLPYDFEITGNTDSPVLPDGGFYDLGDASTTQVPEIGIPKVGLGIDITMGAPGANTANPSTDGAGATFQDDLVVQVTRTATPYDFFPYDSKPYDVSAARTALLNATSPALPAEFIVAGIEADVFEVRFGTPANMPTPRFDVYPAFQPDPLIPATYPTQLTIPVVQKLGDGYYRFTVPNQIKAKVVAS